MKKVFSDKTGLLIHGDCLEVMPNLPTGKFDMILCDLPYGTTACKWDTVIPFEPLWEQYKRLIKPNGAVVLTASQPFTSALVMSNVEMFKYAWVWDKSRAVGFVNAKLKPMPKHEDVLVFSMGTTANKAKNNMTYIPQGLEPYNKIVKGLKGKAADSDGNGYGRPSMRPELLQEFTNYPTSVLNISSEPKPIHPTQKPVALFEYLIKTYTNEGDLVLDNCMGSGTTAVACRNTKRKWVGIEREDKYIDVILSRLVA